VSDAEFEDGYPLAVRWLSTPFWTPVTVARRAAGLLGGGPHKRILDIGAGPGKFCVVGALTTGASFVGVEHRAPLAVVARATAERFGASNARFIHGVFDALDPADYDGIYLFNPFEENLWDWTSHVDQSVQLSQRRFWADLAAAETFLARARSGTRVVTYHGFGSEPPNTYRLLLRERHGSGELELWEQTDGVQRNTERRDRQLAHEAERFFSSDGAGAATGGRRE